MTLHIGIDVGGTFTDIVGMLDGRLHRAKAFSTADVTTGILGAVSLLADRIGVPCDERFYNSIDRLVLGTTIVTNAVDEQKFAATGLITTMGFRDTMRIARASSRGNERDPHAYAAPVEVVARKRIVELRERIDSRGQVVVPVTDEAIERAVYALREQAVESIAVCLLWSFRNPAHEEAVAAYLERHHPDMPYSLSSRLTPVFREYERMVTTTLDAGVKPAVSRHFNALLTHLTQLGLRVPIHVMQVHGGFLSVAETVKAPIATFNSGPVGGVTGARLLGERLGRDRLLTADMGGTSLDAATIVNGEVRRLPRAEIGGLPTSLTAVDIETIGSGGGSIAWVDGRGVMRLGPHSAGSTPGAAAYGRGGAEPTVTDACVVLDLIDPGYYLGGTVPLERDKAVEALQSRLADPLGLEISEAARGIYRLAVSQMANAVRKVTVNRGHDPRGFTLVGFGGACGLFAAAIAAEVGIGEVMVPRDASVFSAYGLLHADSVYSAVQTTPWRFLDPADELEKAFQGLEQRARDWFDADGIAPDDQELVREADMKFAGQIFEIVTRLPSEPLTEATKDLLRQRFHADYEAEFGKGTAWSESEILVVNSRVRATGRVEAQEAVPEPRLDQQTAATRTVVDPTTGRTTSITVYRQFSGRTPVSGPCLLEEPDTTVFVPPGWSVQVTDDGNFLLSTHAHDEESTR